MIDLYFVLYGHCGDVFVQDRQINLELSLECKSFTLSKAASEAFGEAERFILNKLAHIGFLYCKLKGKLQVLSHSQCPLFVKFTENIQAYLREKYVSKIISWEKTGYSNDLLGILRDFESFEAIFSHALQWEIQLSSTQSLSIQPEIDEFVTFSHQGIIELAIKLIVESLKQAKDVSFSALLSQEELEVFKLCLQACKRSSWNEKSFKAMEEIEENIQEFIIKHQNLSILLFLQNLSILLDKYIWNQQIKPNLDRIIAVLGEFYFALDSTALEEHFFLGFENLTNVRRQDLNSFKRFSSHFMLSLNGHWNDLDFWKRSNLFSTEFPTVFCELFVDFPCDWQKRLESIFHLVMALKNSLFHRRRNLFSHSLEESLCYRTLVLLQEYIQTDVLSSIFGKFISSLGQSIGVGGGKASEFESAFGKMLDEIEIGLFIKEQFVQDKFHALIKGQSFSAIEAECQFLVQALSTSSTEKLQISFQDIWIAKLMNRLNFNGYFFEKEKIKA